VANLISRFYTPDRGLVTMGGVDIHAWSRTAWADAVALVAQEPVLFSATVADNIAYGRPCASMAEIQAAAEAANAHEFIHDLEHEYVTDPNLSLAFKTFGTSLDHSRCRCLQPVNRCCVLLARRAT
jgi:ABC-type multidrug transport system fused ATPase/permease subunit